MLGVATPPVGALFTGITPKLGKPLHKAFYEGGIWVCAYLDAADPTIGKEAGRRYLPWQWDAVTQKYAQLALPEQPRPLYRPENLTSNPEAAVYVFEQADMVDEFHTLSGDEPVIATTCAGGVPAFPLGEWDALAGRDVVLWPTNRPDCLEAMQALARKLHEASARVQVITLPQQQPARWSFLDAITAGWTWEQVADFIRINRRRLEATVVPISAARAQVTPRGAPQPEPPPPKQPDKQTTGYRDIWSRIKGLTFAPNGVPYCNTYNLGCAIQSMQGKYGDVWLDEFHIRVMTDEQSPRPWQDADTFELTAVLQGQLGFAAARSGTVFEAIINVASKRRRHEVREWLNSLEWDGTNRLMLMLHRGWGAEASPYTSSVGRCFLMGAVARILKPGCKVDNVPVFEGKGGSKKTSSLETLFSLRWFDNPQAMFGDKDFLQNMPGKWCLELAELAQTKGRALEIVKSTITRRVDTYRASFGRLSGSWPRQCVFAGTIDRGGWNADEAGGRRWWPVATGNIDLDWIAANREQLFAEAVHRINAGEQWWNVPESCAQAEQRARQEIDLWLPQVMAYLELRTETTFPHILEFALGMDRRQEWGPQSADRLRRILKHLGWSMQRDGITWKPREAGSDG